MLLKTQIRHLFCILLLALILFSFSTDPYSIKRISDANFRYEFYTTKKSLKPKEYKIYYWFKGGLIHSAQSGIAGELLHDKFIKFYHSNQLAEQGKFKNGLKVGLWKSWFENGKIASIQNFKTGLLHGKYLLFNPEGEVIEQGKYTKGLKTGKWINLERKDTLIYRQGKIFIKKTKPAKNKTTKPTKNKEDKKSISFFKRIFAKKKNKTTANDQST